MLPAEHKSIDEHALNIPRTARTFWGSNYLELAWGEKSSRTAVKEDLAKDTKIMIGAYEYGVRNGRPGSATWLPTIGTPPVNTHPS